MSIAIPNADSSPTIDERLVADKFELLLRYQERRAIALTAAIIIGAAVASWALGPLWSGAEADLAARIIGLIAAVLGLVGWLRAEARRLRLALLRAEIGRLVRSTSDRSSALRG